MASNIQLNYFDGSSYEILYPECVVEVDLVSYYGQGTSVNVTLTNHLTSAFLWIIECNTDETSFTFNNLSFLKENIIIPGASQQTIGYNGYIDFPLLEINSKKIYQGNLAFSSPKQNSIRYIVGMVYSGDGQDAVQIPLFNRNGKLYYAISLGFR